MCTVEGKSKPSFTCLVFCFVFVFLCVSPCIMVVSPCILGIKLYLLESLHKFSENVYFYTFKLFEIHRLKCKMGNI